MALFVFYKFVVNTASGQNVKGNVHVWIQRRSVMYRLVPVLLVVGLENLDLTAKKVSFRNVSLRFF